MPHETIFSPCRKYRYVLWREFGGLFGTSRYVMFVGLNPSTADETEDDPTIRRCINFAKSWGYDAICMTNLFAFRATDPREMLLADEPIGLHNDQHLITCAHDASLVVAAWGTDGTHRGRDIEVIAMISNLHCLKKTKDGHPGHPLYLSGKLKPQPF